MLFGRERELQRVEQLLGRAAGGHGEALLVSGEAGLGKTALLTWAQEHGDGFSVAGAAGVESEARLPFAALAELAAPVLGHLQELPEPQAEAVRAALALSFASQRAGDTLALHSGFLGLLLAASRRKPLLVCVDDAQWLDPSSARCLAYVSRRLNGARIALLAAARPRDGGMLEGWTAAVLPLEPLDPQDSRTLLSETAVDLAEPAAEAIATVAAGNPLALRELPRLLSVRQRDGSEPLDRLPAARGTLGEALGHRLDRLGDGVRSALLVLAASFDQAAAPIVAACRQHGVADDWIERAEAAEVIRLQGERLAFTHPLLRAAAYDAAPAAERRRAHRALAEHCVGDARAWHLAAAAPGIDEEAGVALVEAAQRATERGAHATAADALERAATLTPSPEERCSRRLGAGLAAAMGGSFRRGAELLQSAAQTDQPAIRAAAEHLLALETLTGGIRGGHENHARLTQEAERAVSVDPQQAAAMFADAGVVAAVAGDCRLVLDSAQRAIAVLPADAQPTVRCQALSILGMGLALRGRTDEARVALDSAGSLLDEVDPLSPAAQSISFALGARLCTGQEARLREEVRDLESRAKESRSIGLLPYFQLQAGDSAYRLGDVADAVAQADAAVANAEATSQDGPLSIALVVRARLHATVGEEAEARSKAERGIELASPIGYGSTVVWGRAALGFLELSLARPQAAIAELESLPALTGAAGLEDPVIVPWLSDQVEAYARAARPQEAENARASLARLAERSGGSLARALAARCEGILDAASFAPHFERALALHAEAEVPLEHGRTLLAFGLQLHRAGERVDARKRLREASAIFERLGAKPWLARTRAELRAAGAIERAPATGGNELTAQEARVARAVARGATNREVAAELFLSPKTIEFHLGRVYSKLGIRSRTELASLVAAGELDLGRPGQAPQAPPSPR